MATGDTRMNKPGLRPQAALYFLTETTWHTKISNSRYNVVGDKKTEILRDCDFFWAGEGAREMGEIFPKRCRGIWVLKDEKSLRMQGQE